MKRIKTAILGATGFVGQQFINILNKHPYFTLDAVIASKKNEGKYYKDTVKWRTTNEIPEYAKDMKLESFSISLLKARGIKIVFSALPAEIANEYEKTLRESGFYVFSNSSSYRMDSDVPILIPEVNPEHIDLVNYQIRKYGGFIITNSNCSTTGIVSILKPLEELGLESVYISTYQSLSGGGLNGVSSLDSANNVIPFINKEEQKIIAESQKILGDFKTDNIKESHFNMVVNVARVPTLYSHLISLMINLKKNIKVEDIKKRLSSFSNIPKQFNLPSAPKQYIEICNENNRPQPALDFPVPFDKDNGMVIKAGRIEKSGKTIKLYILFNNTVRGAAGTSILNAEYAFDKGLIGD